MNSPLIISPELINKLKSTEEYKRNSAISNSINYLIGKIEELTEINSKLIKKNDEMSLNLKKINEKLFQFKTDNNLLKDESKLFKTKLNITEKLNNSLEETIKELNLKIENQEKNFNKKCENFNNILNEYKNIFEELKSKKETLENKLKQAFNDINNCKELIQNYQFEINKLKSNKIALDILNKKKIKSYEILLNKLNDKIQKSKRKKN
jgi:chromosome segregation ATPase